MNLSGENFENLFRVNPRTRHKKEVDHLDQSFKNPIIHRQIHGDKVFVPLNLEKVWNQIR
ncbi:hypothetical protein ABE096_08585 [Robertmurraya massiliosenegalensis]|uniref:hypothetical protein n=1 Tax=Robertmurraya TaxID=2837507 RepID=UPI0039A50BF6